MNTQVLEMPSADARTVSMLIPFDVPLVAAFLSLPIALFPVMGYEVNPVFFLAPLVAYVYFSNITSPLNMAFAIAGICGATSILSHELRAPDGELLRHFLGLTLILISPSLLFLGRRFGRSGVRNVVFWLAIFSTMFVIPVVLRLLISGEAVRGYTSEGYAYLNAEFFGLPIAAAYGVNSLAPLFCFQAAILCGAILGNKKPWLIVVFSAALACAAFVVLGSNSRATQGSFVLLVIAVAFFAYKNPSSRLLSLVIALCFALAAGGTAIRGAGTNRIIETTTTVILPDGIYGEEADADDVIAKSSTVDEMNSGGSYADELTSNRYSLVLIAIRQAIANPLTGTGFASFERYATEPLPPTAKNNTSAHLYYLTLIWKGGLLFAVPFLLFIFLAFRHAWRDRDWRTPEWFFSAVVVALAFGPISLTWELLVVPSAGALAWFLLGVIMGSRTQPASTRSASAGKSGR